MLIKDGTGGGAAAGVTPHNRLWTASMGQDFFSHHSLLHGDVYLCLFEHTQQVNATEEKFGYLRNTSETPIIVSGFMISCNDTGITSLKMSVGPSGVGGGAAVTPINMKQDTARELSAEMLDSGAGGASLVTTTANGTDLMLLYSLPNSPAWMDLQKVLVLGHNDSLLLRATMPNATKVLALHLVVAAVDPDHLGG